MNKLEEKVNRFITSLIKRNDDVLNGFFKEVVIEFEETLRNVTPDSETAIKAEVLELENARLHKLLDIIFPSHYYDSILLEEVEVLEVLKYGAEYYPIKLIDDLENYRSIKLIDKKAKISRYRNNLIVQLNKMINEL